MDPSNPRYDAVTFDMGYTLVYFHPSEEEVEAQALRSLGLSAEPAALRAVRNAVWGEYFAGAGASTYEPTEERDRQLEEELMARILGRLGLSQPGLARQVLAARRAIYKTPKVTRLYPEVLEVLQGIRATGYRLGLISNWSWDLDDYIRLTGLDAYLDVVVASSWTGCEKPHPAIFHRALRELGCDPARAIHIGDSYSADVLGARGVGMDALWLDRQGNGGHPDCCTIRELREVLTLLGD